MKRTCLLRLRLIYSFPRMENFYEDVMLNHWNVFAVTMSGPSCDFHQRSRSSRTGVQLDHIEENHSR